MMAFEPPYTAAYSPTLSVLTPRKSAIATQRPGTDTYETTTSVRLVPRADELLAVFLGGAAGALLRAGLDEALPHGPTGWPWGTFIPNLAGTAILAWLFFHVHHGLPANARRRRLFEPGLCGALTTFSTFQLELLRLLDQGAVATGLGYAGASLALGFVLAWAGVHLTRTRRSTPGEAGG